MGISFQIRNRYNEEFVNLGISKLGIFHASKYFQREKYEYFLFTYLSRNKSPITVAPKRRTDVRSFIDLRKANV